MTKTVGTELPVTVRVAVRGSVEVFSVQLAAMEPLPVPPGVIVHQEALLLADQLVFE